MLHYNPRHVSIINMPIFRRTNCIITASGSVALCKWLYSMPDESRLIRHTVQPFTEISIQIQISIKNIIKYSFYSIDENFRCADDL